MHDEPMPPGLPGTPQTAPAQAEPPLDLLIVGAGLAGVGAAAEFLKRLPDRRIAVLESRADLGGTWDLFRYPGVRSDSDMFTFGYRIRPWRGLVSMVDGTSIREYVRATAVELGVLPLIALLQIGIIVCIGVLLDTLLVRTVIVPALAFVAGEKFWWPRKPAIEPKA